MRPSTYVLALCATSVFTLACSDDPASPVDASGGGTDGGDEARCLVKSDYGDLGTRTGTTGATMSPTSITIVLDEGPPRDSFYVNLKNGAPAGTYQIDGANANGGTCSVCLSIVADVVSMQGPTKFYYAASGSITLTATEPPAGTVSNITFVETTAGGSPTNSGCASRIGAMSFGPT